MKSHAITVNGEEYNVMEGETITIKDWSDYDPDLGNNGGKYVYTSKFWKDGDSWVCQELSSCDFIDPEEPYEVSFDEVLERLQRVGDVKIELLEPTSPESTIAKFIEKNNGNGGMHHLAFAVEDGVAGALAEVEEKGIRLIDKAPRKGAEGLNIAFLHPKSTLGVLTELCEKPE